MAERNLKKAITLIKRANKELAEAKELLSPLYDGWITVYPADVSVTLGLDKVAKDLGAAVSTVLTNEGKSFDASFEYDSVSFHEYAIPREWMDRYTGGTEDV